MKTVDLTPAGRPPNLSRLRRLINVLVGAGLLAFGAYVFTSTGTEGRISPFTLAAGAMMIFGGVVLAGSAIFPRFTLQKLDRSRWR